MCAQNVNLTASPWKYNMEQLLVFIRLSREIWATTRALAVNFSGSWWFYPRHFYLFKIHDKVVFSAFLQTNYFYDHSVEMNQPFCIGSMSDGKSGYLRRAVSLSLFFSYAYILQRDIVVVELYRPHSITKSESQVGTAVLSNCLYSSLLEENALYRNFKSVTSFTPTGQNTMWRKHCLM